MRWKLINLVFWLPFYALAQNAQLNIPLNSAYFRPIDKHLQQKSAPVFSSMKPLLASAVNLDSISSAEATIRKQKKYNAWLWRKLKHESLFHLQKDNFTLDIDPLFNFEVIKDQLDTVTARDYFSNNTRGFRVQGSIGSKFSFESSFYETQSFFPNYLRLFVANNRVVPGQGYWKDFKEIGYDYSQALGMISYTPIQKGKYLLNFQFGHGKLFIGEGYRSMLLSDNSFNYPHLKSTFQFGRFQYTSAIATLMKLDRVVGDGLTEDRFMRNAANFNYLEYAFGKWVNLGLFEGLVWNVESTNGNQKVNTNYYFPIIGLNSALEAQNERVTMLWGLNAKIRPLKSIQLYGQLALNNYDQVLKSQAGIKIFDVFKVKNLYAQFEYNVSKREVNVITNREPFAHYNQFLTHPRNNDFSELVAQVSYEYQDFFIRLKANVYEIHQLGFFYNSIKTNNPNHELQYYLPNLNLIDLIYTVNGKLNIYDAQIGYTINRRTNASLSAGVTLRSLKAWGNSYDNQLIYVSFKTSLLNHYYDF